MRHPTKLPSFNTYGNYSGNYGAHALTFTDADGNDYWFSYKTLVAFRGPNGRRVVLKNYWSTTTGKHLNAIDGGCKRDRVDQETFDRLFREAFGANVRKQVA
jgi:hypothetical protein